MAIDNKGKKKRCPECNAKMRLVKIGDAFVFPFHWKKRGEICSESDKSAVDEAVFLESYGDENDHS